MTKIKCCPKKSKNIVLIRLGIETNRQFPISRYREMKLHYQWSYAQIVSLIQHTFLKILSTISLESEREKLFALCEAMKKKENQGKIVWKCERRKEEGKWWKSYNKNIVIEHLMKWLDCAGGFLSWDNFTSFSLSWKILIAQFIIDEKEVRGFR